MSLKCCSTLPSEPAAELVAQVIPSAGLGSEIAQQQDLERIFQHLGELLDSSRRIEQTLDTFHISRRAAPTKENLVHSIDENPSTAVADASDVLLHLASPRPHRTSDNSTIKSSEDNDMYEGEDYMNMSTHSAPRVASERYTRPLKVSFGDVTDHAILGDASSRKLVDIDTAMLSEASGDSSRSNRGAVRINNTSVFFSSSSECDSHGKRNSIIPSMEPVESSKSVLPHAMTFKPTSDSGPQTLMLPVSWPASIKKRRDFDGGSRREIEELLRAQCTNRANPVLRVLSCNELNGDMGSSSSMAHVKSLHVGNEDTMFPTTSAKTIAVRRANSSKNRSAFVLSPSSQLRIFLDVMSLMALCFDMIATPLVLAWDVEIVAGSLLQRIFWTTCIFWTIDIFVNFRTGFYFHGNLEMRPSMIARHYCRTWFIPDFIIVLGDWVSLLLPLIVGKSANVNTIKLLRFSKSARLIRLLGVLRMAKLAELFERIIQTRVLENHEMLVQIPPLLLVVVWVNHLICCVWFALGRLAPSDTGLRWIDQTVADDSGVTYKTSGSVYQYVTAFHWSLAQMTPGSMQVSASNTFERTYNNFCLVLGVICYSSLISMITSKMTQIKVMRQHKSSSLLTLRRFLRQNELPKDLRIAVQKQILDRMKKPKLLTANDVDVLSLLSLSVRTELQYELCRPAIESHPLFFLIDTISSTVLHHLCKDSTEFLVIAAGDNLFLPGIDAESAYFLIRGGLSYTQDPDSSKVLKKTYEDVTPREWLCEVALWAHWTHVGTVEGTAMSELLVINAAKFTKALRRHSVIWQITQEYAKVFHKRLVSSYLACDCFPSDLKRPFEDFNELFISMPKDVKVFIGLLTIELMQKSPWFSYLHRKILSDLRDQVLAGTCTLGLTDGNQVVRIVEVAALRLNDNDGYVFANFGELKDGAIKGRCQLPGAKVTEGEDSAVTIQRVLQEKARPIADLVDIVSADLEVSMNDSVAFKVSTKYLRTIYKGVLKNGIDVPGRSNPNRHAKFKSKTKSKMSILSTKDTGTWSNSNFNRPGQQAELPDYKDVSFCEADGTTYICGWLLESQFDYLATSSGQELLHRWLKGMPQISESISPASTALSSRSIPKGSTPNVRTSGSKLRFMSTFGLTRTLSQSSQ